MSHQFLAILIFLFAAYVSFLIVKYVSFLIFNIALPMWRFMVKADAAITLYPWFKDLLKTDFSCKNGNKIVLDYSIGGHKCELEFSNTNEAISEFERIVEEALGYYDKLGWIANVDNFVEVKKKELLQICNEIKMIRWQKQ